MFPEKEDAKRAWARSTPFLVTDPCLPSRGDLRLGRTGGGPHDVVVGHTASSRLADARTARARRFFAAKWRTQNVRFVVACTLASSDLATIRDGVCGSLQAGAG